MKYPIFIVGSGRCGTTLLYHMILSSGGFAVYRAETHVFTLLPPYFGDLRKDSNRKKLIKYWVNSVLFQRSGLNPSQWSKQAWNLCFTYADLLVFFMESIAKQQKVKRWAECTPAHLLFMKKIKLGIPKAKFIHIIRDGRGVALSLNKLKWVKGIKMLGLDTLNSSALHWEWIVKKGRQIGNEIGSDYTEVFFEELITNPKIVLSKLGEFIEHDLNYNHIMDNAIGSVKKPNTAFKGADFSPKDRWRMLPLKQVLILEELIGGTLREFGYQLTRNQKISTSSIKINYLKLAVQMYSDGKFLLKYYTPLGHYFAESPQQFDKKMLQIFRDAGE